ncbi:MAG: ABC transporter permease, partial [Candidatus Limnocylindria bacterium]
VTVLTMAIGYPMAYTIAFRGGRYKNILLLLVILPFFTSFIIRTISWKFILADQGFLLGTLKDWGLIASDSHYLGTSVAVISGITYNYLPFVVLPLYVALEKIDYRLVEAATDLYASRLQAFLRVTVPLSISGVFAGSLLAFIPAAGDYINAELLGGTRETTMIGNVIQTLYLTNNDYPQASAISLILMAALLAGVVAYTRILRGQELTA